MIVEKTDKSTGVPECGCGGGMTNLINAKFSQKTESVCCHMLETYFCFEQNWQQILGDFLYWIVKIIAPI